MIIETHQNKNASTRPVIELSGGRHEHFPPNLRQRPQVGPYGVIIVNPAIRVCRIKKCVMTLNGIG